MVAWIRRHPLIADAALALAMLWVSVPPVSAIAGRHHVLSLALVFVFVCPLIWRRRAPSVVFGAMAALVLVQLAVTPGELNVDIAILVAFYTVAAYEPPKRVLGAALMMEAGAVLLAAIAVHTLGLWVLLSGLVAAAGLLGYYARTRRAYLATLVDRAKRLEHERDQQAQLAAAAERTRIAREMHDIVAHNIAVMIALAEGAAYTAPISTGQAVSLMGQVSETGRSALTDMRRLLGIMRDTAQPERTPQPTLDDIEDLLATVRAAGLPVRLTVTGQPFPLPAAAQLTLYRLIQEALTNTLKHAPGAAGAQVSLTYAPGEMGLEVTDTGCPGAVPAVGTASAPSSTAGHGIAGMRERAAVFGGKVNAGPRPGGGWRIHTVLRLGEKPVREGA